MLAFRSRRIRVNQRRRNGFLCQVVRDLLEGLVLPSWCAFNERLHDVYYIQSYSNTTDPTIDSERFPERLPRSLGLYPPNHQTRKDPENKVASTTADCTLYNGGFGHGYAERIARCKCVFQDCVHTKIDQGIPPLAEVILRRLVYGSSLGK